MKNELNAAEVEHLRTVIQPMVAKADMIAAIKAKVEIFEIRAEKAQKAIGPLQQKYDDLLTKLYRHTAKGEKLSLQLDSLKGELQGAKEEFTVAKEQIRTTHETLGRLA